MHQIILAIILVLNGVLPINQMPDTMSLKFERKIIQNKSTEIVRGISYYKAPQRLFIEVQYPLNK